MPICIEAVVNSIKKWAGNGDKFKVNLQKKMVYSFINIRMQLGYNHYLLFQLAIMADK